LLVEKSPAGEMALFVELAQLAMHAATVMSFGIPNLSRHVEKSPAGDLELFVELGQHARPVALEMVVRIVLGISSVSVHVVRFLGLITAAFLELIALGTRLVFVPAIRNKTMKDMYQV